MSNKLKKKLKRLSIAELKHLVGRPELVEVSIYVLLLAVLQSI